MWDKMTMRLEKEYKRCWKELRGFGPTVKIFGEWTKVLRVKL